MGKTWRARPDDGFKARKKDLPQKKSKGASWNHEDDYNRPEDQTIYDTNDFDDSCDSRNRDDK